MSSQVIDIEAHDTNSTTEKSSAVENPTIAKMENVQKKSKAGRKKGVRSIPYENALREYFNDSNTLTITELSKKYKIDRSMLNKAINTTKQEIKTTIGTDDVQALARDTRQALKASINNVQVMKNTTNPILHDIADDIMLDIQRTNYTLARNIQIIGQGLLKDLHTEIGKMRERGEMDMRGINQSLTNLELANKVVGMPRPTIAQQININQKQAEKSKTTEPLDISIKVIE